MVKKHFGYQLVYYMQPGLWMDNDEVAALKNTLDHVNRLSGKNFTYGIFSRSGNIESFRNFIAKINLCLMKLHEETIGFFYNIIIQEKPMPIIHAGLVVITKNKGVDLITAPYLYLVTLQWEKYGAYYYTNISSTPIIIGNFSMNISQVWPSHRSKNLLKPPSKDYNFVLSQLYQEYIVPYFSDKEIQVDFKRFVMRSPAKDMGFETDFRNLPRHKKLLVNLFCDYWIDYAQSEDLIQVGKVNFQTYLKNKVLLGCLALKRSFQFGKRNYVIG